MSQLSWAKNVTLQILNFILVLLKLNNKKFLHAMLILCLFSMH